MSKKKLTHRQQVEARDNRLLCSRLENGLYSVYQYDMAGRKIHFTNPFKHPSQAWASAAEKVKG